MLDFFNGNGSSVGPASENYSHQNKPLPRIFDEIPSF
jgi:hypothetical protein